MAHGTPYFTTDSGTRVYGSNRPGHSAWMLFDKGIADMTQPQQDTVVQHASVTSVFKYVGYAVLAFVAVIIVGGISPLSDGLVSFVAIAMLLGLPALGIKRYMDSTKSLRALTAAHATNEQRSIAEYMRITSAARNGDFDSGLPANVRSWAVGALSEERVGAVLESLGPSYEVSHDLTIFQNGREVANIDHLVSTSEGTVIVDAKSWSGTARVDQSTGEITSGNQRTDEWRRKAIHSLRREAQSLGLPLRAVVIAVDKGKVIGDYNGQSTNGIARILDDNSFDTYIVEIALLAELMGLLSANGSTAVPMAELERVALSRGSQIQF